MAADELQPVQAGDALNISAKTFNTLLDSARDWKLKARGRVGAGPHQNDPMVAGNLVWISNTTGGTLPIWSVVTPTGTAISPVDAPLEARKTPVFTVSAPVTTDDVVLVTIEPVADGKLGRALCDGYGVAQVDISSTTHKYARPSPGNIFQLESALDGPVRLVAPAGLVNQLTMVQIGLPGASAPVCLVDVKVCPTFDDSDPPKVVSITTQKIYSDGSIRCETDPTGCCQVSYNCVDGRCVEVAGLGGEFTTLEGCQSGCYVEETLSCGGTEWPKYLCMSITTTGTTDDITVKTVAGPVTTNVDDPGGTLTWPFLIVWSVEGRYYNFGGQLTAPCDPDAWGTFGADACNSLVRINGSSEYWLTNELAPDDPPIFFNVVFGCPTLPTQVATTADPSPVNIALSVPYHLVTFEPLDRDVGCRSPEIMSFDCVGGHCVERADTHGTYDTLEDCEAAPCIECCEEDQRPPRLCGVWTNLVGDVWEGSTPTDRAMTRDGTSLWVHNFAATLALSCVDNNWTLTGNDLMLGGSIGAPESVDFVGSSCDPFIVTFDVNWDEGNSARITFVGGECCELDPMTGLTITFDPTDPEPGEEVTIVVTPVGGVGPFLYDIDFGDGTTPLTGNGAGIFTHTYPLAGTYTVEAHLEDVGCPATAGSFADGDEDLVVADADDEGDTCATSITTQPGTIAITPTGEKWFYLGVAQPGDTFFYLDDVTGTEPEIEVTAWTGTDCDSLTDLGGGTFTFGLGGGALGITPTMPDTPIWIKCVNTGDNPVTFDYSWTLS